MISYCLQLGHLNLVVPFTFVILFLQELHISFILRRLFVNGL